MGPTQQLKTLTTLVGLPSFPDKIRESGKLPLKAAGVDILQINVGRLCNLACRHCHVHAGPDRQEIMSRPVLEKCLDILQAHPIATLDITGGSPEMNPHFEWFVAEAAKLNRRLMIRSNLTLLTEKPYSHLPRFFAENCVEVVTSLPDCLEAKSDRQRGAGSFARTIASMRELNRLGYAAEGSGLVLDLVHNPVGAYLPGSQAALEHEYRRRLAGEHGVLFSRLFSLTNLPVGRYLDYLISSGNFEDYLSTLCHSFNPAAVDHVMCRTTLSVGWDGSLYDCDFNQMLGLKVNHGAPAHILDFDIRKLQNREIVISNHCYGCVAGAGSSCQGATTGV